tara:strand:- start:16840 stop:17502 length:663 start_codon:yes stop_codon:yes gene_type:complete
MAAPTKGNTTSANPTPGGNSKTQAHTHNTGSDGLIIAQFTMSNTRTYTYCTYGGQAMTQLYQINRGGLSQRMAFFYLENPPTGNNNLVVGFNGSQWNPISIHIRSFTNSGGVGASGRTGGQSTPNTQSLTVEEDSLIMITSCSINAISTQQIPTGTNRTFTTHNTNRQVGTGAISADAGHSAGSVSIRGTSTFGSVTLDRTEIKGLSSSSTAGSDFFLIM